MRGFTDKALILFPKQENVLPRGYDYLYQFRTALDNLVQYLLSLDIEPHVFYSDDVAREFHTPDIKYIATLGKADNFFVSRNCGMTDALTGDMITFPKVVDEAMRKFPTEQGASQDQRFAVILKRDHYAVSKIIPQYKLVVHFLRKGVAQYHVASKPDDGKIRIVVDALTFKPTVYLSGSEIDPISILDRNDANRSLISWGK